MTGTGGAVVATGGTDGAAAGTVIVRHGLTPRIWLPREHPPREQLARHALYLTALVLTARFGFAGRPRERSRSRDRRRSPSRERDRRD